MTAFFKEGLPIKGPPFYIFVQGSTDSWDSDLKFQKEPALSLVLRGTHISFLRKKDLLVHLWAQVVQELYCLRLGNPKTKIIITNINLEIHTHLQCTHVQMLKNTQKAHCTDARSEYDAYGFNTVEMVTPF